MRRYIIVVAVAIPLIAVLFVGAGYIHDEVIASSRVSRGVTIAGTDVSRYTASDAAAVAAAYENELASQPVQIVVDGTTVTLSPIDVGLTVDEDAVAATALTTRRELSATANFAAWGRTFISETTVEVPVSIDEEKLADYLAGLSETAINKPAYDGAIKVDNGVVTAEYPQAGLRVDVEAALPLVKAQLLRMDRAPVVLPLVSISPRITDDDVDEALAKAEKLVGSSVTLRAPGQTGTMVFTPAGLASALRSEIVVNSPAVLEVSLDTDTLTSIAARSADQFTIPPTDAAFAFDDETKTLTVIPAVQGKKIDLAAVPAAVETAALSTRNGALVLTDGDEAEFTTEMAEAMGPFGEVSTFTTKHPAGQSRVTNIQLLADEIGGNFVMPDEIFSINDTAGERTLQEGYVRAGAIINGRIECCDSKVNIGGGTSQFATTFYNAVFFGCYEDIFHQPHSLYFSRYPFVREATLGFPAPDVKFRNDSASVVYIDTTYTPSSITVTLYGNNGGRVCTSERSGNTITRVMTHPDGSVTTQDWSWNYKKPRPPDDAPAHEDHDDTTTTTSGETSSTTSTPPDTTTSTPPDTTTPTP